MIPFTLVSFIIVIRQASLEQGLLNVLPCTSSAILKENANGREWTQITYVPTRERGNKHALIAFTRVHLFHTSCAPPFGACVRTFKALLHFSAFLAISSEMTKDQRLKTKDYSPVSRKIPHFLCIIATGVLPLAKYRTSCA